MFDLNSLLGKAPISNIARKGLFRFLRNSLFLQKNT